MVVRSMRPRFRVRVPMTADQVVRRLEEQLRGEDCPCRGVVADRHHVVELRIRDSDRNFWSPTLGVSVSEEEGPERSVVHGLIGPEPAVWTLFAFLYFGTLTLLGFAGMFGLVQWWLGLPAWGLYAAAGAALATVALYVTSRIGQKAAAAQTVLLRHFLEEALDLPRTERAFTERDPYHETPAGS